MTRFLLMPGFYGSSRRSRQSVAGETSGPDRCIETGIGGVRVFTTSVRYRAASNFSLLRNSQRAFRRAFLWDGRRSFHARATARTAPCHDVAEFVAGATNMRVHLAVVGTALSLLAVWAVCTALLLH